MARKKITDLIEELRSWLPNYDHKDYPTTLFRILASLPGGEELEDMGYEPMPGISWHEADQLGRVLEAIQNKGDVEDLVAGLIREEEEEEVGEARRHSGTTVPNRADLIAALELEPEGRTRGQKYDFTTPEFWRKIRTANSEDARRARRTLGVPEPGSPPVRERPMRAPLREHPYPPPRRPGPHPLPRRRS